MMKRVLYLVTASLLITLSSSCSKESDEFKQDQNKVSLKNDPGEEDDTPVIITFSGTVVDIEGSPIIGVHVSLTGDHLYEYNSETVSDGNWEMDSVKKLSYTLSFEATGYQSQYHNFSLDTVSSENFDWGAVVLQE